MLRFNLGTKIVFIGCVFLYSGFATGSELARNMFLSVECPDEDENEKSSDAEKAAKMLAHDIGVWDCTWDYLDRDGKIKRTTKGTEAMAYALDKKIVEIKTSIPDGKLVGKSMRFYNPVINKVVLLSVGPDGNHWELHQDPGSRVMYSLPHKSANGKFQYIRFTTVSQSDNEINVLMEQSSDNKKWFKVFKQKLVRRK